MFDEIIVGAGSSGSVIAARLSEGAGRKVLLIEAGPDYESIEATPLGLLNGHMLEREHDWGFTAEMVEGRSVPYPRGKVTGGSSAVNACLALRGIPADYDEWGALGNPGWTWEQVQPIFRAIENDEDFDNEHHGTTGPTLLRRHKVSELTPTQQAFYRTCRASGFAATEDHNHPASTGVGTGPWNLTPDGTRVSTAIAYLHPARERGNLIIKPDSLVNRVIFDGSRAVGVEVITNGAVETLSGRRITLCAGAVGTPAILLRSGVGTPDDLADVGIQCRVPRKGVGRNLIDHTGIGIGWESPPGLVEETSPFVQVVCRFTAPGSVNPNDMQIMLSQVLPQPALRLSTFLVKPYSRGRLKLRSAAPDAEPDIRLNLMSEQEDIRRMRESLRVSGELLRLLPLSGLDVNELVLDDGERVDPSTFLGRLKQDAWIDSFIRRVVRHYVHPVGTARMGPSEDGQAVVDQYGRVHDVSQLRVVDASIMPTVPSANTNLACIMLGERVAAWMSEHGD